MICKYCGKTFVDKYHPYAKTCSRECCIKLWQKEHSATYQRKKRQEVKAKIFDMLGNKCSICGYSGIALQVDHVNGGGLKEINMIRKHGNSYTYWLHVLSELQKNPSKYRLLCANCNIEEYYRRKRIT